MAAIKPLDQSSDKWVKRASIAGSDYQAGISAPKTSWVDSTKAINANWKAGITAASGRDAFVKGVEKAGDARWKDMSLKKGPSRFAEGVAIGKDDWSKGFSPYQTAISAIKLTDRGPTGSMQNYERSKAVGTTLRTLKEKIG